MSSSIMWIVSYSILCNIPSVELTSLLLIRLEFWISKDGLESPGPVVLHSDPEKASYWKKAAGTQGQPWMQGEGKLSGAEDSIGRPCRLQLRPILQQGCLETPSRSWASSGHSRLTILLSCSFLCLSLEFPGAFGCLAWKWAHFIFGPQKGSLEETHCVAFSS